RGRLRRDRPPRNQRCRPRTLRALHRAGAVVPRRRRRASRARTGPPGDMAQEGASMSDLSFAHSWVLLFLPVVLAVFALWVWGLRRGQALARALSRVAPAAPGVTGAVFLALAAAFA